MVGRCSLAGALFLWCVPTATAQQQDPPHLARALERAARFDAALGPQPQPAARWLGGDRLAWSPAGKAPWIILEVPTLQVLDSDAADAAVGGPAPAVQMPLGLASFGPADPESASPGQWTAQAANGDLVVSDAAGATRLRLSGAENYGWTLAPRAWNYDRRLFMALRVDNREVHRIP